MKILGGLLAFVLVVGIGGLIYLSIADVQVEQKSVTKPVTEAGE